MTSDETLPFQRHASLRPVLLTGLGLLLLALLIRTYVEGLTWIRWYMPERIYLKLSGK